MQINNMCYPQEAILADRTILHIFMKQLFFFLFSLVACNATGQQITSPDGKYVMAISGDMTYSVTYGGSTVVARGQMGVEIDNRLFESALGEPQGLVH